MKRFAFCWLIGLAGCAAASSARAQQDIDALSTRSENPLSNLPSLTFNHIFSAHVGRFRRPQNITNVQPNVPISISDDYNVILRANTPLNDQPVGRSDRVYALGDTAIQALFTRKNPGSFAWGLGPAVALPTRTVDAVGFGLPGGGVAFAVVKTEGRNLCPGSSGQCGRMATAGPVFAAFPAEELTAAWQRPPSSVIF